jgi:hypothetical protein
MKYSSAITCPKRHEMQSLGYVATIDETVISKYQSRRQMRDEAETKLMRAKKKTKLNKNSSHIARKPQKMMKIFMKGEYV